VRSASLDVDVRAAARAVRPFREHQEGTMHDNPEATEEEQEQAQTGRQDEEESMRYPSQGQPDPPDDAEE
jgi:hypothetical protein